MTWDEGLIEPEQTDAAGHAGTHARMLAGPGTGKTYVLTRRVRFLIENAGVEPEAIVALTFTRAAASELRRRVKAEVPTEEQPRISTLHSFALRQLLRNAHKLDNLPQPLRIADDWEERYIILEDLKARLDYDRIAEARARFEELAADWETLSADQGEWTPDPAFLGAWREHRTLYGYTLRAELVYQLKRALEQVGDFDLETPVEHLLVDEYQDLNRCDLSVVRAIEENGAELFVAGDDDQSIYGFRRAHPAGIRRFPDEYADVRDLPLTLCLRCRSNILALAGFVARLDPERTAKDLRPDRDGGEVALLNFGDQREEARGIAEICRRLVDAGHPAHEILILLRTDRYGAFSEVLVQGLANGGVPVATPSRSPLDEDDGELVVAVLRLLVDRLDSLAWRTVLQQRKNGIGAVGIAEIADQCRARGERFGEGVRRVSESPGDLARFGTHVQAEVATIDRLIEANEAGWEEGEQEEDREGPPIIAGLRRIVLAVLQPGEGRAMIEEYLTELATAEGVTTVEELLSVLAVTNERMEQAIAPDRVNILSMHQAKGLTADSVFVAGCDDEQIPGRQETEPDLGDERRLLYVSLTRARNNLFVTYCDRRIGRQMMLGRAGGTVRRHLTRFLQDAPVRPVAGMAYANGYTATPPA